ncbi:hypothetical protein [Acinetobacter bereziniae]|uniref:hypothetical protein n=1 Tax=Acinetobacter bereziniae TaxID=106648 RepID=UPI00124FD09E|nr:hypothetical protein [Acinetobacter bereziniae]
MSNYTPPKIHHVDLKFKDLATGSTALNFGAENAVTASLDAVINTAFIAKMQAQTYDYNALSSVISTRLESNITGVVGDASTIDSNVNTAFNAAINVVVIDRFCSLESTIQTNFKSESNARFDINFNRGVFGESLYPFQCRAKVLSNSIGLVWSDPYIRAHQNGFQFEFGATRSIQPFNRFDKGLNLHRAVSAVYEQTLTLRCVTGFVWQENKLAFITQNLVFEESKKLKIHAIFDWVELVRKNKIIRYSHEVAHVFEKRYQFIADQGLEFITTDAIPWEKAKSIHYRKHAIQPWPKPEEITPNGWNKKSIRLNFCCTTDEVDRLNARLNFEPDKCLPDPQKPQIPEISNKNWWYIVNELSVTRLDNGENINVLDGNYSSDRSRWCWSYSLTVPNSEISKLEPINAQPVILKIMVNGHEHHMLLENRSRSQKFGYITYTLSGRSQSALLDSPYAPTRTYLQENERTSVQLAQAELDRVNNQAELNWKLVDVLGWIVPINSLSYSNQTPIAVIKMLAESAGGFVYSEKAGNKLTIKPKYKKTFWDNVILNDYDRLIPESIVTDLSTDYELYPDYNGITLSNDRNGNTGQVKRSGTAADILLETVNNPLFTVDSMGAFGKAELAKAGMVETHSIAMPNSVEIGECSPGELIGFNGSWWGIVDAVSVSFTHAVTNQAIKVERVNRDE